MALKCVIVDDSYFIRETLSSMIVNEGYEVLEKYEDGESFLTNLNNETFDVVFLDIILPKISGLDVLKKIQDRTPSLKVVMLSGLTQGNTISAALQLGASEFVSKPINKDKLIDILEKFSNEYQLPSIEDLSKIGVACVLISHFFSELSAHASSTLREEIANQCRSILEFNVKESPDMFTIDLEKISLEANPNLWGAYSEGAVFEKIKQIPGDLKMELEFLYPEDFIATLFNQAILTMSSRNKMIQLFDAVSPVIIGLPDLPELSDPKQYETTMAGTNFEDLEGALALSVYYSSLMGPNVFAHINEDLIDEITTMKNSIFYSTIIRDDENFQEGLFGPLPVSGGENSSLSAMIYPIKMTEYESQAVNLVFLIIYFEPSAEKIVSDYTNLSFIIKGRLSTINYLEDLDRGFARSLIRDIVNFILEQ